MNKESDTWAKRLIWSLDFCRVWNEFKTFLLLMYKRETFCGRSFSTLFNSTSVGFNMFNFHSRFDWGRPQGAPLRIRVCCLSNSCLLMQQWSMRNFLRPRPSVALTTPVKRLFLKICRILHPNSSLPAAAGSVPAQVGSLQVSLPQGLCRHWAPRLELESDPWAKRLIWSLDFLSCLKWIQNVSPFDV